MLIENRLLGSEYISLLFCLGCHSQVPQTEGLKQQKIIVSQFGRLEANIKVLAGLVPSEDVREGSVLGISLL